MLTLSLFALLAVALILVIWVVVLLKHQDALEEFQAVLLERIEVQEDLISTQECIMNEWEPELLHLYDVNHNLLQETKTLKEEIFATKERYVDWVESLMQESDEWADIAKDREDTIYFQQAEIEDLKHKVSKLDKSEDDLLDQIFDLVDDINVANQCIWDKEKELTKAQELIQEIAGDLYSIGFQDKISAEDVFKLHDYIRAHDEIPF